MQVLARHITLLFWSLVSCSALTANSAAAASPSHDKPYNILFILVDDLGIRDLHYTGSTLYQTPNIDRLAHQSVRFSNAYASAAVCSPTRAALMTGKSPARLGITNWIPGDDNAGKPLQEPRTPLQLARSEVTIAEILKAKGYRTFFAGKWHLGGKGFLPQDQGFDVNVGGGEYGQPPDAGYYAPYHNPMIKDGPKGEYLADRLTGETMNFIRKKSDQPFFAYLAFYDVHVPIPDEGDDVRRFEAKAAEIRAAGASYTHREGVARTKMKQENTSYAAMIYRLDKNIGRLMAMLQEQGLDKNTVVIFTSDNGGYSTRIPADVTPVAGKPFWGLPTSNEPYRAGKGWLYEGGIRVPLLISLPGTNNAGKQIPKPVISTDLFYTIADIAGVKNTAPVADGVSILPLITGAGDIGRHALYWHFPHYHMSGVTPSSAIRRENWKLIEYYETGRLELFDLGVDPYEKNNLASKYPERTENLKKELRQTLVAAGAKFPSR